MEDLDNNQFQRNELHDIADDTVAQTGVENGANHVNDDDVHIVNNREWTNEHKYRIVEIDTQERMRGKNFMKRVKQRWQQEYPADRRTAQNLIDNARRFKTEGWRRTRGANENVEEGLQTRMEPGHERKSLEWTTEMKISLVTLDEEERAKGRGFMKRIKERWDMKYPEYQAASWQKLRNLILVRQPEIRNLIQVRRRQDVEMDVAGLREIEPEVVNEVEPELQDNEIESETDKAEVVYNMQAEEELSEADKELERFFQTELENLNRCTMLQLEPREKLPKVLLSDEIQTRANKILEKYLRSADTIREIIDIVYAMGKAVGYVMGVKPKEGNHNRGRKAAGRNRRERKLKADMKELRQNIAKTGNELYRRKQQRKASAKEKKDSQKPENQNE